MLLGKDPDIKDESREERGEQILRDLTGGTEQPGSVSVEDEKVPIVLDESVDGADPLGNKEKGDEETIEQHIINQKDLGKSVGTLLFELQTGEVPPLTEEQERLLDDLLFAKGYVERSVTFGISKDRTIEVVFRTGTAALAQLEKESIGKRILREDAPDLTNIPAIANLRDPRLTDPRHSLSVPEQIGLEQLIHLAANLYSVKGELTWDEAHEFESAQALEQRLAYVSEMPKAFIDRLVIKLYELDIEIFRITSGDYLENF